MQVGQACRVNQAGRAEEDMMARQAGQCRVGTVGSQGKSRRRGRAGRVGRQGRHAGKIG